MTVEDALEAVVAGAELDADEMRAVIGTIMRGDSSPEAVSGLLVALAARGETVDEITGAAQAMRDMVVTVDRAPPGAIDTAGTGGDHSGSFNISTLAAIVAAGAGVPVAKHGNRAATSKCGSAELLAELGVRIDIAPPDAARAVAEVGIGFLYARTFHPAMAAVAPIRAALPIPTIFNRLGPLTNPMFVTRQLLGVGSPELADDTVEALARLDAETAWVVHSRDGMDEISTAAPTDVIALQAGATRRFTIEPGDHVAPAQRSDLAGGDAAENAAIARRILDGEAGPQRDAVLLNAAAALCVADGSDDLAGAFERAAAAVDSGAAAVKLSRWVEYTQGAA